MKWNKNKKPGYQWTDEGKKFYEQRNKALYQDKVAGMGIAQLTAKYNITTNQLYKIFKREERNVNARSQE